MHGLCRGIFATAFHGKMQVFSPWTTRATESRQVPQQNSECPLLVASACEVSNRKWMVRVGLARNWGNPHSLEPLQAWLEEGLLRIATPLAGRLESGGKLLPCSVPRDTSNGFPSSHKRKQMPFLPGTPVSAGVGHWGMEGALPRLEQGRTECHIPSTGLRDSLIHQSKTHRW